VSWGVRGKRIVKTEEAPTKEGEEGLVLGGSDGRIERRSRGARRGGQRPSVGIGVALTRQLIVGGIAVLLRPARVTLLNGRTLARLAGNVNDSLLPGPNIGSHDIRVNHVNRGSEAALHRPAEKRETREKV